MCTFEIFLEKIIKLITDQTAISNESNVGSQKSGFPKANAMVSPKSP